MAIVLDAMGSDEIPHPRNIGCNSMKKEVQRECYPRREKRSARE